jgi:hypothetical protein
MHLIEPFYLWRDIYNSEEDPNALNYGAEYSEFHFTNKIYNYLIHPQWDSFGSETLFYKQIYVDYEQEFCVLEFIGEWNDAINNDIMMLKTELIDLLIQDGIANFILIFENVLNFHGDLDDYYEEWREEVDGNIFVINALDHVLSEMDRHKLDHALRYGGVLNEIDWRATKPDELLELIEEKYLEENL